MLTLPKNALPMSGADDGGKLEQRPGEGVVLLPRLVEALHARAQQLHPLLHVLLQAGRAAAWPDRAV